MIQKLFFLHLLSSPFLFLSIDLASVTLYLVRYLATEWQASRISASLGQVKRNSSRLQAFSRYRVRPFRAAGISKSRYFLHTTYRRGTGGWQFFKFLTDHMRVRGGTLSVCEREYGPCIDFIENIMIKSCCFYAVGTIFSAQFYKNLLLQ